MQLIAANSHRPAGPDGRSVSWAGRRLLFLLAIALILPLLSIGLPAGSPANAHPDLVALAAEQPGAQVQVIAQMVQSPDQINDLVEGLGGVVTKDLSIINAVGAQLSAAAAVKLAADPAVRWISLDHRVENARKKIKISDDAPTNTYLDTLNVNWLRTRKLGQNIGVVVLDSGVNNAEDLSSFARGNSTSRLLVQLNFSTESAGADDAYGHGTHVAGIIGGSGSASGGAYKGIAPKVDLISLKINDGSGKGYESDVVAAMQWVLDHQKQYNIRVVNMSFNSSNKVSYHESPMDAAAEILWFNGIVIVASAGNKGAGGFGNTVDSAPANDPFFITVGASDEKGTADPSDDTVGTFSAFGVTEDGHAKPDIIAPGKDIVSLLSSASSWGTDYPERSVLDGAYFRLSGTSMAAPMVTGAVVALLHYEPWLTPDQVKYRLLNQSGRTIPGHKNDLKLDGGKRNYPYLDIYAVVQGSSTESANTGLEASRLLWSGTDPVTWDSVSWNSVSWNSVSWNSVSWNSVSWNSVSWNSVSWLN